MNAPLLAKSVRGAGAPREAQTLVGHTRCVCEAFAALFGGRERPSRPGSCWLAFFGLATEAWECFWCTAMLACGFHDLGKANSGFQDAVRGVKGQVLRHEHLSALLLCLPGFDEWMASCGAEPDLVLSAVLCHHLKAATNSKDLAELLDPDRKHFQVYAHALQPLCDLGAAQLGVAGYVAPVFPTTWNLQAGGDDVEDLPCTAPAALWAQAKRRLRRLRKQLDRGDERRARLLQAVRSALIVADSAGSGLLREGKPLAPWLEQAFSADALLDRRVVWEQVIAPRIREIERKRGVAFSWLDFQEHAERQPPRTLLLSACGSGKTLAAWRWIAAQVGQAPRARIIFLYPTRATAGEGFRDYVSWAPEADAALVSGTAAYELEHMFDTPEDIENQRAGRSYAPERRLYALGFWHKRIFSATVHQFLGFMQHAYGSTCLLPLLADSVVVFDEVHSYDRGLFSALRQFLRHFNVPALCMTATLPPERRRVLVEECGLSPYPEHAAQFASLEALAARPRYSIAQLSGGVDEATTVARHSLDAGERVLWVVNTVDRCQELAQALGALCYHSRFRLQDRQARHKDVLAAFQDRQVSVLAVTTQVCEMSLDLDADLLLTEIAPIPSLVQRMGRCNRHLRRDLGRVCCYVPPDCKPYDTELLGQAETFLAALDGQEVSQNRLAALLHELAGSQAEVEKYSAFLKSAPWASSREQDLMDATDLTVSAILESDLATFRELQHTGRPFDGLVLPAPRFPRELARPGPGLPGHLHLVPDSHYDPRYGLFKAPLEVIV